MRGGLRRTRLTPGSPPPRGWRHPGEISARSRLAVPISAASRLHLPSSSLPSRCSCMPEIHEQCFMPDSRRQVRAQKAGCLPSERAACTHSWNACRHPSPPRPGHVVEVSWKCPARERLGDLDGGPEGCGGAVLRLPPQRLQFRLRDTSETLPRTLRAVCRAARGIGGAWNICSCTSVIGISSERRIITAVRKWCPVPSAPATKIRFVGATPGALPPPPSADARAYGLWTRRGRVTGHGGVEVGCGGVSRGGRVAARLERSRRRGAVRCV